jgi:hypothetical protein
MAVSEEEINAFLAHHGVKGMHWGVRREHETDEHRDFRKEATKQFRKEASDALVRRIENTYGKSELTKEEYEKLSDKDVKYRTGKTLNRLTTDAEKDNAKSALFVSTNKSDAITYKSALPYQDRLIKNLLAGGNHKYDGYQETTFKATKTLVGPSEKARVDAFIKLLDTKSVVLKNGKTITGREYLKRIGVAPDIKRLDAQRAGLKYYKTFIQGQWQDNGLNSAYFNNLRDQGYNAVSDDNDRKILTKDPLIILDPSGAVKQMSVRQLTTDDILKAQKSYKDLTKS